MSSLLQQSPQAKGYGSLNASAGADAASRKPSVTPGTASFASRMLFSYATPMMQTGNERQLANDDLWDLEGENRTASAFEAYNAQFERHGRSVPRAMWHAYGWSFFLCGLATVFSAACNLFAPQVLHHVIDAFSRPDIDVEDLTIWLGAFFASRLVNAIVMAQMSFYLELVALRLTVSLKTLLFEKAMRRSIQSKNEAKTVDISNLYSSDVSNILWAAFQINNLWILPVQIGVVVFMLYDVIGLAAFAGLGVIGLSMLLSFQCIQAKVSLGRISEFLVMHEYEPLNVDRESSTEPADVAVAVRDGNFGWNKDALLLKNVNLEVKIGDLVIVHGSLHGERRDAEQPRSAFAPTLSPREVKEAHAHETEESKAALADAGRLVDDEEREEGRVSKEVFLEYFNSLGGVKVCFFLLTVQTLWQVFQIGSDLWLSKWT
ncbi:hypothetical protein PybrP1_009906, partial [[Pythium] brassicae (nom. inval.)]